MTTRQAAARAAPRPAAADRRARFAVFWIFCVCGLIGPLAGATSLRVTMRVPAALAVFIAVAGPVAVLRAGPAGTSPGARSRRSAPGPPATARPTHSR